MNKLIHFKDIFFNLKHVVNISIESQCILFYTINGVYRFEANRHRTMTGSYGFYDESEKKQLLEDLESLM